MTSDLEALFDQHCRAYRLPPAVAEHRFHPERRWLFDRAWPAKRLAVEIEGGIWVKGRHTRGAGFEKDCEKYNAAALAGWTVLRFAPRHVKSGEAVRTVARALGLEV